MASPGNPFAPRDYGHLEAVTDRVWIWRNIVNSAVFVGDRGIAVIDTQVNQSLARRLRDHLQKRFAKPVLFAVNTHYHWDHAAGNAVFKADGTTLVASRRTATALIDRMPRQKGFLSSRGFELGEDPLLPDVWAEDAPLLDLGGLTLELQLGLAAETADPTLVWCPEERCLASGDTVMTGSFPIFGQPSQREGLENEDWLAALEEIRAFSPDVVLPGHGPVARETELGLLERIMRYFLTEVGRHHAAGRTLAETIALMEDDLPAWISRIPEVWGTPRYAILRVWAGLEDLGQPGFQHVKPSAIPTSHTPPLPDQDDRTAWEEAIHQRLEGGDAAAALAVAEAAIAVHDDPWSQVLVARAAIAASRGIASVLEKGDCFQLARTAVAKALAKDPGYGPALLQEGQFFTMMAFRNGDEPERGDTLLEQALADQRLSVRERAEAEFYRGIAARTRDDEPRALAHFAVARTIDPGFLPATLAAAGVRRPG